MPKVNRNAQRSLFEIPAMESDPLPEAGSTSPSNKLCTLFLGLIPPLELAKDIFLRAAGWTQQQHLGGNLRPAHVLHISLCAIDSFVGSVPPESFQRAKAAAEAMTSPAFELVFDRVMHFAGKSPPYVLRVGQGLEQVKAFQHELAMAVANTGGPSKDGSFTPHMTLAYSERSVPEQPITPIRWEVKDFVLINSHHGETHYDILGRWPLLG